MANDINSSTIVGRLTRDGELKYTNSGMAVLKFSIANNWSKKIGDSWEDQTNFFDVTFWGKRAESLSNYLKKGTQVVVKGELRQDRWEQDGQQRSRVFINADNIQLVGGKSNGGQPNNSGYGSNQEPAPQNYNNPQQGNNGNFEDDIPF